MFATCLSRDVRNWSGDFRKESEEGGQNFVASRSSLRRPVVHRSLAGEKLRCALCALWMFLLGTSAGVLLV